MIRHKTAFHAPASATFHAADTLPKTVMKPMVAPVIRTAGKPFSNIALIFNMSIFGYGVCQGASRFALERGGWLLFPYKAEPNLDAMHAWLRVNHIDGIICCLPFHDFCVFLRDTGIPYVNVLLQGMGPGVTSVTSDSEAVARQAADFFLEVGFAQFAFCGYPGLPFSNQREAAYRNILANHGYPLHLPPRRKPPPRSESNPEQVTEPQWEKRLGKWLDSLPKPIALWAANDSCGQQVIRVAQQYGIAIPGELTVLGVDNDETLCNLCTPTLSSIDQNREGIGYAAARTLDGLMRGTIPLGTEIRVPPKGVIERQSTNIIPVQEPLVAAALCIIRNRVRDNLTNRMLGAELHCAPAKLNRLFTAHLGRTVSDVMTRFRVKRLTEVLQETDLPLKKVAAMFGFSSPSVLSMFIQRQTGFTPLRLRNKSRLGIA